MKKPSSDSRSAVRNKLIGLGERSIKKSYYPELKQRMLELERFRTLLDEAGDDIFLVELPSCHIADVNKSACSRLGMSRKELLNATLCSLVAEDVRDNFLAKIGNLGEQKGEKGLTSKLITTAGEILHVECSFSRYLFEKQEYAIVVARDILERIQAEEERANLEEQLMQAMKMEALGKLSGGIAHDFNNILQVISGYSQLLLLRKNEHDTDYTYLHEIRMAAQRASDIVRRLLAFSRKMEIDYKPINLNDIINNTIEILAHTIPKMISIETNLQPDLWQINGDAGQMEQAVMNLANNAVDAMPDGGKIVFTTSNMELGQDYRIKYMEVEPGPYVLFSITDSGSGMDEPTRQRIFEPFFTTKEVGQGTGLGLSIIYGIVKSHKGHVSCYSEPGVGTTFKVYLPVLLGEIADESKGDEQVGEGVAGGKENILVVDDEEMILSIVEEMLVHYGYAVQRAMSGEEALEMIREAATGFDLVVMDLGMPGMGGEKTLKEILKLKPDAKVIVASGYGAHEIAKNPQEFGAAGFISKPYSLKDFLRFIRQTLDAA